MRRRDVLLGAGAGVIVSACSGAPKPQPQPQNGLLTGGAAITAAALASSLAAYARQQDGAYAARGLQPRGRDVRVPLPSGATTRIRVMEVGSGDPILLLHGGNSAGVQWLPLMARLPGARLIAPDL